jgi:hypothetical protein
VTARCAVLRVALLGLVLPGPAWAQVLQPSSRGPFRPWSIEVDAGVLWPNGIDLGSTTASITANQTPAADYPLFETAADLDAGPGFEGANSTTRRRLRRPAASTTRAAASSTSSHRALGVS